MFAVIFGWYDSTSSLAGAIFESYKIPADAVRMQHGVRLIFLAFPEFAVFYKIWLRLHRRTAMLCNSLCLHFVSALFTQGAFPEGTLHEVHACEVLEAASARWTAQDALTRTRGHFCFHVVISLNGVPGSCIEGVVTN